MEPLFLVNGIFPAYWVGQEGFSPEQIQHPFAYVLDAEGWKLYKRNGVSTAVIKVDSVSGLATLPQKINFTANRIPLDLIRHVTAWFRAVYAKHRSEAVGYLYYRPASGEWQFVPPTQTATGASTKYAEAPRIESWQVVGTIHSHGSMSAFHSGVDDRDEECFDGVHVTVGHVDSIPEYSCSLVVQGEREIVDPSVLIDGMAPVDAVPAAWMDAVKLSEPSALLGARASALYERYYAGGLSEEAYLNELEKLEEEAEKAKEAERARQAREAQGPFGSKEHGHPGRKTFEPGSKKGKGGKTNVW